jgi:hypothetical protein
MVGGFERRGEEEMRENGSTETVKLGMSHESLVRLWCAASHAC